jgi:hypothetical protein
LDVDFHFTPFLSLANVIGDENIKVKSWDVIRIPAAQQAERRLLLITTHRRPPPFYSLKKELHKFERLHTFIQGTCTVV